METANVCNPVILGRKLQYMLGSPGVHVKQAQASLVNKGVVAAQVVRLQNILPSPDLFMTETRRKEIDLVPAQWHRPTDVLNDTFVIHWNTFVAGAVAADEIGAMISESHSRFN